MTEFIITCDSELKPDGSYDVKRFRELVRCKDCRQNNQCSIQFKFADPDNPGEWFCAYGKPRSE